MPCEPTVLCVPLASRGFDTSHYRWGHLRPMLGIVASLLIANPDLHITQFVPLHIYHLVDEEFKRWNLPYPSATSRLKLVR